MTDSLDMAGQELISSKRAAELSGYAQDYIGQLARKGLIEAKRIGGLWYVSLTSLNAYKSDAELYTPRPPQARSQSSENDSIISFDGRDYLSAARAAKITGYNPDYVGQLARTGKILSRQIGNRWYVDRESIIDHKSEKDALLGAVQAESVGIARPRADTAQTRPTLSSEPFFQYRTEAQDLLPKPVHAPQRAFAPRFDYAQEEYEEKDQALVHPIPIRKAPEPRVIEHINIDSYEESIQEEEERPKRKILMLAVVGIGFVAVALSAFMLFKKGSPQNAVQQQSESSGMLEKMADQLSQLFGKEITYERNK